jgi:hypothetical protein
VVLTDLLLGAGMSAAAGKTDYKEKLKLIEERHFDTVQKTSVPVHASERRRI